MGVCPYVKPARIPSLKKPLKEMAGSWAVTSTGDVYKNGAKASNHCQVARKARACPDLRVVDGWVGV